MPSPRSARRLLFGVGPKVGNAYAFVPEKPLPRHLFLSIRTGGDCSKDRQALDDCQSVARRFRESGRSEEFARRLTALREDRQVSFDQVDAPSLRVSPISSILKRSGSSGKPHGRHVSFGDVTVREIENCLDLRPSPVVSSLAPVASPLAGILKRPGSPSTSRDRHVSFGEVTVREFENCLAPLPRPFPPPVHALFPPPKGAQFRPPVESHPVSQAYEPPPRQSHQKCTEVHTRRVLTSEVECNFPWGIAFGVAAAWFGVSLLMNWW